MREGQEALPLRHSADASETVRASLHPASRPSAPTELQAVRARADSKGSEDCTVSTGRSRRP